MGFTSLPVYKSTMLPGIPSFLHLGIHLPQLSPSLAGSQSFLNKVSCRGVPALVQKSLGIPPAVRNHGKSEPNQPSNCLQARRQALQNKQLKRYSNYQGFDATNSDILKLQVKSGLNKVICTSKSSHSSQQVSCSSMSHWHLTGFNVQRRHHMGVS